MPSDAAPILGYWASSRVRLIRMPRAATSRGGGRSHPPSSCCRATGYRAGSRRMETLAERILRLRTERGLSQREIEVPGVSNAYISRIEKGQRTPSLRAIRTMAERIGVTPEYLETGHDHTTTDELAAEALRLTDAGLWIMVTREGVTLTRQHAGERFRLDRPGANLTETLYATLDRVDELLRLDVEEERIQARRAEISGELAAPE